MKRPEYHINVVMKKYIYIYDHKMTVGNQKDFLSVSVYIQVLFNHLGLLGLIEYSEH